MALFEIVNPTATRRFLLRLTILAMASIDIITRYFSSSLHRHANSFVLLFLALIFRHVMFFISFGALYRAGLIDLKISYSGLQPLLFPVWRDFF
jgi:hypothetical protein